MDNATPARRHDDANDTIRYDRPAGVDVDTWREIVTNTTALINERVSEALGRCVEHDWCINAGQSDHDEFHCSEIVDLIPSTREGVETSAVGAWLVKDRDGRTQTRLVIEGDGELTGERFEVEFKHSDAFAMLCVFGREEVRDLLWDLVIASATKTPDGAER
ncbi:hypothetical protein [Nocardioides antri]|uniref:Uncharacterized protein n=1 Tax=Nocardioides antri TaxID=2607659 RepID=A0A5B1M1C2_9ACTN|nr:hypothetical protein [Nocardioides antri]KAA1426456.1 hypothetical protein F0U47_13720 [Nocardioides antri]